MEIKVAKNVEQSKTIAAANRSEKWAIALLAIAFVGGGAYVVAPKNVQDKIALIAGGGAVVATAMIQRGLVQVKEGRFFLGDLNPAVANVALLPAGQGAVLEMFKPVIEGQVPLSSLPAVQELVNNAVKAERGDHMIAEIRKQQPPPDPADFDRVNIPAMPKPRILDPHWTPPV